MDAETITLALLDLAERLACGEITPQEYEAACARLKDQGDGA